MPTTDTVRARAELAELRARRADRPNVLAARVIDAVAAGELDRAALAERQRRAAAALLPDDDGELADRLDAEHNDGKHEPAELPHACPLCAEDTGDPFGLFELRTIADTVAALAALQPVDCPRCSYRAFDAADLAEHAEGHEELDADDAAGAAMLAEDDAAMSPHGRCDTCGAPCDAAGCTTDRGHAAALDA